jgi:hypothetical protein
MVGVCRLDAKISKLFGHHDAAIRQVEHLTVQAWSDDFEDKAVGFGVIKVNFLRPNVGVTTAVKDVEHHLAAGRAGEALKGFVSVKISAEPEAFTGRLFVELVGVQHIAVAIQIMRSMQAGGDAEVSRRRFFQLRQAPSGDIDGHSDIVEAGSHVTTEKSETFNTGVGAVVVRVHEVLAGGCVESSTGAVEHAIQMRPSGIGRVVAVAEIIGDDESPRSLRTAEQQCSEHCYAQQLRPRRAGHPSEAACIANYFAAEP